MENTIIGIIVVLIGLAMGSFFACAGYRIPNKISIVKGRSFCPECKKQLKWYMNIPVFSYIFLGGKCAYCKKKISIIYPFIEIVTALLYFLSFELYINTPPISYLNFVISIVLASALMITIVSDFRYYYISDRVIFSSIAIALIIKYIYSGFTVTFYSLLSGIGMLLVFLFVKFLGDRIFKKESLGGGDIKLVALIGISLGFVPSLISIFLASIFGLIFSLLSKSDDKNGIVPFGPFLLIGALICFYFSEPLKYLLDKVLNII